MAVAAPPVTHTFIHVEIPAKDTATLVTIYSKVFGWQFGAAPGMENYQMAQTSEGSAGVAINPMEQDQAVVNYVGVPDAKAHAQKITAAGGTIVHSFSIAHMGHGAVGADPEGNPIGVWQEDESATDS